MSEIENQEIITPTPEEEIGSNENPSTDIVEEELPNIESESET